MIEKVIKLLATLFVLVAFGVLVNMILTEDNTQAADANRRLYYPNASWNYVVGDLVVDRQTGVEYWLMDGRLTLLVDKDGKPVIYKGE